MPSEFDDDLLDPARTAIQQCMALDADESCLVVTDDAVLLRYPPGDQHGEEPPTPVSAAMRGADVVLAPTTRSLSHTRARGDANEAGARVATLPGITPAVFETGLDADYERIADECMAVIEQVADADEIRVTTPAGTDLTVQPGDREWHADTGIVHEGGGMTNLPAGEVYVSPVTGDGTYVVDGTMRPYGVLDEGQELTFEVEDGYVTHISDDEIRQQVETAAAEVGQDAYNLAELGIGTNVAVTELVGSVLLDEKAGGTVHIALGDDAGIGGDTDAPIHLDGVIREPTVYADGVEIDLPTVE